MNYAVIFRYTFDPDTAVYLFETEEEAKEFMREAYEEEVRIDTEENGWNVEHAMLDDGSHAYINDRFDDHDDTTFMEVAHVYN